MPFLDYTPIDQDGLRTDISPWARRWSTLTNWIFRRGNLRQRPGFLLMTPTNPLTPDGYPVAIAEVDNPRATATASEFGTTEFLRPDATISNDDWVATGAATLHEATDEVTANGDTDYMVSTGTSSAVLSLSSTSLTGALHSIVITVVARNEIPDYGNIGLELQTSAGDIICRFDTFEEVGVGNYALTDSYRTFTRVFTSSEITGGPITAANLNNPRARVFNTGSDANTLVTQIQIEVRESRGHGIQGAIPKDRIMVTSSGYLRLDNETSVSGFTNVAGLTPPVGSGADPLDWTILYGQIYFANGLNTTRFYPNASGVFEAEASTKPYGRTIAAFADRILLGWATDAGTTTPERIIYSNRFDGHTFTGASAGDFDVLNTPGGVQKLLPLTEEFCSCYKQQGIYILRQTGDSAIPIVPDMVDEFTGIIAKRSARTLVLDGTPVQLFLGANPTKGTTVFMFDGSQVVDVGAGLVKFLREDINPDRLAYAFAEVDPETRCYWLWVAEGSETIPTQAWVMDLERKAWTRADHSWAASVAGRWTLAGNIPAVGGANTLILGRSSDGRAYKGVRAQAFDSLTDSTSTYVPLTLETGDIRLAETERRAITYRVHLMYINQGPFEVAIDISIDGGLTYTAAKKEILGASTSDSSLRYAVLDPVPIQARRFRVRLSIDRTLASSTGFVELTEAWIQTQPAGVDS